MTHFFVVEGRLRGAIGINRAGDLRAARRIIAAGTPVDLGRLEDESIGLATAALPT